MVKKSGLLTAIGMLLVAFSAMAQTDGVVRMLNRLRAPGGTCAVQAPPVAQNAALDEAAARLARGMPLETALQAAGYRATQAQAITAGGDRVGAAELEALLARRFCAQLGKPALTEAGVHGNGRQVWIVLAAPFAPRVDMGRQEFEARMLALVNRARAVPRRCGGKPFAAAPPVVWNAVLEQAAARHADDMAQKNYFSHTGHDGSTPAQRVTQAGYSFRATGENIAAGQTGVEAAVDGWIKSPPHCAVLMHNAYTELGGAFAVNRDSAMGIYWVQVFGTPR